MSVVQGVGRTSRESLYIKGLPGQNLRLTHNGTSWEIDVLGVELLEALRLEGLLPETKDDGLRERLTDYLVNLSDTPRLYAMDVKKSMQEVLDPTPPFECPKNLGAVVEYDGVRFVRTDSDPRLVWVGVGKDVRMSDAALSTTRLPVKVLHTGWEAAA